MILKIITTITVLFISAFAFAEVITLDDGSIYFGSIVKRTDSSIVVSALGGKKEISTWSISSMEKDFTNISRKKIEILLEDGSVLKGNLMNYDEEVGILLKTDFGNVTLPYKDAKSISDPVRKKNYEGHGVLLGITGAVYFPITDFGSKFTPDPLFSLFAEFNSYFLRGLYFGVDFTYMMMNYTPNALLIYNSFQLKAYATYRFLQNRNSESAAARMFIPFISFGMGAAFNTLADNRPASAIHRRSETDLLFTGAVGLDLNVWGPLLIRLQGGWSGMNDGSVFLHSFSVNLGVVIGF